MMNENEKKMENKGKQFKKILNKKRTNMMRAKQIWY